MPNKKWLNVSEWGVRHCMNTLSLAMLDSVVEGNPKEREVSSKSYLYFLFVEDDDSLLSILPIKNATASRTRDASGKDIFAIANTIEAIAKMLLK